jgi:hypothetical protein
MSGPSGWDIGGWIGGTVSLLTLAGAGIKSLFKRADRREAALERKEAALVAKMETRILALEERDERRELEFVEMRAELNDTRAAVMILAQEVSANNPHSTALQLARRLLKGRFPIDLNTPPDMTETLRKID